MLARLLKTFSSHRVERGPTANPVSGRGMMCGLHQKTSSNAHSYGGSPLRYIPAFVILLSLCGTAQEKPAISQPQFTGTYEQLRPAQKQLIDEWYAEYNRLMNEHDPPSDYNQLPLSTRTTFEAVSHALLTTNLTNKDGQPTGNALDVVQAIETINGKVPQARGDLQFRMYVVLKPDAVQTLKNSREFFRDRDNTVYHHGYPMNYRQGGTAPTIQISVAKDGRHADIDVDYRSAKFPAALVNGHLTAANSDVRAGNNTQKHLQRWDGLTDWWRNLFGLADASEPTPDSVAANGEVPPVPRKATGKLDDAVQDYLSVWLVEQKPELAAAYLSPRSFPCLAEYGPQAGTEVNAGVAPYLAARDMAATDRLIGKPSTLQNAVQPAPLADPSLLPIKHPYAAAFGLYQVPNGKAADFDCDPERAFDDYDQARVSRTGTKYGRYYASVFQLKPIEGRGDTVTMLWTKEGNYWKIISWDIEPEDAKPEAVPDTREHATAPIPEAQINGDAELLRSSQKFLKSWLVADDFNAAAQFFSSHSCECVSAFLSADEQQPQTPDQYATALRAALTTVGKDVGHVQHLRDAIEPVEPDHDDLKAVPHSEADAYALIAVPDYLASSFACQKAGAGADPGTDPQAKSYGRYYAMLFALRTPGDHPASLAFLWSKENGQWKIISYSLMAP